MGRAFGELILRIPAKDLPKSGGLPATLLVLIDEDSLMGRIEKAGILDTGEKISPALARRLACEAEIIPIVLGGDSQPLDVGRGRRFHPRHQRYAMLARDRGCRAEGCDRTHGLHAHHKTRWTDGGHTTVNDGMTLCHWHHAKAHDTSYETTYLAQRRRHLPPTPIGRPAGCARDRGRGSAAHQPRTTGCRRAPRGRRSSAFPATAPTSQALSATDPPAPTVTRHR